MKKKIIIAVVAVVAIGIIALAVLKLYINNTYAESDVVKDEVVISGEQVATSTGKTINSYEHIVGNYKSEITDPVTSEVMFSVEGMTGTVGKFKKFDIAMNFAEGGILTLNVSIDASSIYTASKMRDEHLQGEEFFDVAKHPTIDFKSNTIVKGDTSYIAEGQVSFLGGTYDLKIPFNYLGSSKEDANVEIFEGRFIFDRTKFGMEESEDVGNDVSVWFYTQVKK